MLTMALLAAVGITALPAGSFVSTSVSQLQAATQPAPKLVCKIKAVKLVGTSVVADGGCKLGAKSVPAVWSWVSKAADLSGAPCSTFGTGKGKGKTVPALKKPASVLGGWRSSLPGHYAVDFTVKASSRGQKASASRPARWRTPNSYVYCGAPPKLVSLDGPQPSALVWATPPVFDGTIVRAGTIRSVGNGECRWQRSQPLADGAFLAIGQRFVCDNNTDGMVRFTYHYFGADNQRKCSNEIKGTSSFVVFPGWGPGAVYVDADVVTWVRGAVGSANSKRLLIYLKGNKSPCDEWK